MVIDRNVVVKNSSSDRVCHSKELYVYRILEHYTCALVVALFPGNYRASGPTDVSNANCYFRKYGSSFQLDTYIFLQIKQSKTTILI